MKCVGCMYQGPVCVHSPVSFQPSSLNMLMVSYNTEHQITRLCFALRSPLGWKGGEGLMWSASAAVVAFVSHLSGWKSIYNLLCPPASCSSPSLWCKGFTSLYSTFQYQTESSEAHLCWIWAGDCNNNNGAVKINKHCFNFYEQIKIGKSAYASLEIVRNSHFFLRPRCAAEVSRLSFWCH